MDTDISAEGAATVSLVADLELQHLWLHVGTETVLSTTFTAGGVVPEWPVPLRDVVQLVALAMMRIAPASSAERVNVMLPGADVEALCRNMPQLVDAITGWLRPGRDPAPIPATDAHRLFAGVTALVQPFLAQKKGPEETWSLELVLRKGYTRIPWRGKYLADCPDGPRYKALGNSMAIPVIRWLGERIYRYQAPC